MITAQHLDALRKIWLNLENCPLPWVITGSLGMALQGVPVEVHDIDIQTDRDGAYEIERRLSEYVIQPVKYFVAEKICSHLGQLEIDGLRVEIIGGIQKLLDNQSWEEPIIVERYMKWVEIYEMRIPVLELEYEVEAYLKLGRVEKAAVLRKWLEKAQTG